SGELRRDADGTWIVQGPGGQPARANVRDFLHQGIGLKSVWTGNEAVNQLAQELTAFVEKTGKAPRAAAESEEERLAFRVWKRGRNFAGFEERLSPGTRQALSTSESRRLLAESSRADYSAVPMRKELVGEDKGLDIIHPRTKEKEHFETVYL